MKVDVVIDIETVVNPVTQRDVEAYMKDWVPSAAVKKEETIARHREEAEKNAVQNIIDDRRFSIGGKRMVSCAVGIATGADVTDIQSWAGDDLHGICVSLAAYLNDQDAFRLIGWNHIKFDLPEIVKSFKLTDTSPPRYKAGKWDLVDLSNHPYRQTKLKDIAKAFGLSVPDTRGGDVQQFYQEQNWAAIKEYNESDVRITGQIFNATQGWFSF